MADFEKMYYILFHASTDAIEAIRAGAPAHGVVLLATAQCEAESLYIESADTP